MKNTSPFIVYDASAGSGKTFTLVKSYLKIVLTANNDDHYKKILAITFTNKAVTEMKERIVNTLKSIADPAILSSADDMFLALVQETGLDPLAVHQKSKRVLKSIIHNYASFDISTIDGFTHRVIRTFAHDLKIPVNFEVSMDTPLLIKQAVDALIAKAGQDKALTKVLLEFALEKADDDKSWNISLDLEQIAKLLTSENDLKHIHALHSKSLEDFKKLKTHLKNTINALTNKVKTSAQDILTLISEAGLLDTDFTRKTLPSHFTKIASGNFNALFKNQLQQNLEEGKVYNKTTAPNVAAVIDALIPTLLKGYMLTKADIHRLEFLSSFYKQLVPLSLLNEINKELQKLKKEKNVLLISEFNAIIQNEIKDQPAPFIYERIGEKFKHYFIDEFQDTSSLQWSNLIPLIGNALEGKQEGNLLIVGDAKQSIYRWRGGHAEQFVGLRNEDNPFHINKEVATLPINYRSKSTIVSFCNDFFGYLSQHFNKKLHQDIYTSGSQQEAHSSNEGFVNLDFLDIEKGEDTNEAYSKSVITHIKKLQELNYPLSDICILVRKKAEGIILAQALVQEAIPIISSETLLLNQSPKVHFINALIQLGFQPKNNEVKLQVLDYLANEVLNLEDPHSFFMKFLNLEAAEIFEGITNYNVHFDFAVFLNSGLYEAVEYCVDAFKLADKGDAYVLYYMDLVFDYTQKRNQGLADFISYWEQQKEKASLVASTGKNAVQIMTIHKSKGLEFPIVIFPFAKQDVYDHHQSKSWYPIDENEFAGFNEAYLSYGKYLEQLGDTGSLIYQEKQAALQLDNFNVLYVVLTRAVSQLYIITENTPLKDSFNTYNHFLKGFLQDCNMWNEASLNYSFGKLIQNTLKEETSDALLTIADQNEIITNARKNLDIKILSNTGYLWDSQQAEAIEKGNLIHLLLSLITYESDIDNAIHELLAKGAIKEGQVGILRTDVEALIRHPEINPYFQQAYTVYNERDIISKNGMLLRPDRICIDQHSNVTIIDYKTGLIHASHEQQLFSYQDILEEMDFKVVKKLLLYINKGIEVKSV
jgi:ATP-dependent exoDNAse (exonuclease V) beta subunit